MRILVGLIFLTMADPNSILAKKIYDKLSEEGLLSSEIEEATFTTLLKTGKIQSNDWDSSLVAPDKQKSNETTEATD
jgi:hypothetical protein